MDRALSAEEASLLALLSKALTGRGTEPAVSKRVLALARAHTVTPLLHDVLLPENEGAGLRQATRTCVLQFYRLLFLTRYYVRVLSDAGVCVAVLKGAGVSAYYPVPEYRKSGDIDLLLLDPDNLERAAAALESAGARRSEEQHANHHVVFIGDSGIDLELHLSVAEDFDNRRANESIARVQSSLRDHIVEKEILPGVFLPVAEDGYQAFFLLLHMLQHFLRAGFGLRLLCDWVVFWNRTVEPEQTETYLALVESCGVSGFSRLITQICVAYLGLEERFAAPLLSGEERFSAETCAAFLREVFDAQEFGRTSAERMVVLRSTGLWDYVREFHHQMHLNFPRAGRVVLLWPLLWIITLARFLYNNRAVRKTSLRSILKETGRRSGYMKELRLFRWD